MKTLKEIFNDIILLFSTQPYKEEDVLHLSFLCEIDYPLIVVRFKDQLPDIFSS